MKSKPFAISITKNISISVLKDGKVFIHMKKHEPLVISAEDKYRKGVELDVCDNCKIISLITIWDFNPKRKFCGDCALKVIKTQGRWEVEE